MIQEIIDKAKTQGACRLTEGVNDWETLARLFFSPQGREFCIAHIFPDKELWERMKTHNEDLRKYGVFVDAGAISFQGEGNIALVGETQGDLIFDKNNCISHVLLLHGASARIRIADYAVVEFQHDRQSHDFNINKDKTAILL